MKIGIIGNMNNNNFTIMRYFRDLGFDAYLLLNSNDGKGLSSHFKTSSDTWELEKWKPYIVQTSIPDDPISLFAFPISYILFLRLFFRKLLYRKGTISLPVTKDQIKKTYSNYTFLVGSSLSPSYLDRANISLDLFFPYSLGVEWLGSPPFVKKINSKNIFEKLISRAILKKQTMGIKKAKHLIRSDNSLTKEIFDKMNLKSEKLLCPMLYNRAKLSFEFPKNQFSDEKELNIRRTIKLISQSDFSVLSHTRNRWVRNNNISEKEWRYEDKNNDWLIYGFSKLLNKKILKNPLLILFDYGKDVVYSKKICEDLEISECVIWMPKMERKYIMWLLSKIDVGVGEFYELPNMLFGGTGYEILASGKPLIQGFNFNEGEFSDEFKIDIPPLLAVRKQEDVYSHLLKLAISKTARIEVGKKSAQWFDENCGIELAKKWLKLFISNN